MAFVLLSCPPAWCQVGTGSTDGSKSTDADAQMQVPPPVNGQAYATEYLGESETNYWSGGVTVSSAYSTNITGNTTNPQGGMSFSVWPTLALHKTTDRSQLLLSYSPGVTVYQNVSAYNQADQNLSFKGKFALSPRISFNVEELFRQTSNVFDQPNPLGGLTVIGSVPPSQQAIILPIAEQITNTTGAQLTYQLGADSMVGASGSFGLFNYPNPSQAAGLYNSQTASGSAFYSRRVHERYYIGGSYQFEHIFSYPLQGSFGTTTSQIQTVYGFVTIYLKPTLSISLSGGPQYYTATQVPLPSSASWSPLVMASLGWQTERTTAALSWSRTVSGAGGLNGIFHTDSVAASINRQLSQSWSAGVTASYANYQTLTPFFLSSSPNGNTVVGTASVQRSITDNLNLQFGYAWAHQDYVQVAPIVPNTSRVFISVGYRFSRPLHR
jgi:hypothetical protein